MNLRDKLLQPITLPREVVPLPELGEGVEIIVQGMTTRERGAFELQFITDGKPNPKRQQQMRERLIIASCIDADGKKLFTLDDLVQLGQQSVAVIDRIVEACNRVNGTASVETAAKNSEATVDA